MAERDIAVFDIDGTLSDHAHRFHLAQKGNYQAYHEASVHDQPHEHVVVAARAMKSEGKKVILITGRTEEHRGITEEWLKKHGIPYDELHMRPTDSRVSGDKMKEEIAKPFMHRICAVYEDADKNVKMWVRNGIPVVVALPDLGKDGVKQSRVFLGGKEHV